MVGGNFRTAILRGHGVGGGEGRDHRLFHQVNGMGILGSRAGQKGFTVGFCRGQWSREDTINLKPAIVFHTS